MGVRMFGTRLGMLMPMFASGGLVAAWIMKMGVGRRRGRRRRRQAPLLTQMLRLPDAVVVLRAAALSVGDRPLRRGFVHVAEQRDVRIAQADRRFGSARRRGLRCRRGRGA